MKLEYRVSASEKVYRTSDTDVEDMISDGLFTPQNSGTFYDLLPSGVEVDPSTIKVTGSASSTVYDTTYETVKNYRDTGRTPLTVHASIPAGKANWYISDNVISRSTSYSYVTSYVYLYFTAYYPWDDLRDHGTTLLNSAAYETGNPAIANGRPDDGGTITEKNLMVDLNGDGNPVGTPNTFLYDDVKSTITANINTELSLFKAVMGQDNLTWGNGQDGSVIVPGAGTYSYRLRLGSSLGTTTTNIVLFDSLENYTPADAGPQWHGTLESVDVAQLESKGVAPVVYYSTVAGLDLEAHHDLTDTTVWSTIPPANIAKVTAVAIDCRTAKGGGPFTLPEEQTISATLNMRAPSDGIAELVAQDAHAFNNVYSSNVLHNTLEGSTTDQLIHNEYTQVGIKMPDLGIEKTSDPPTGTAENPRKVEAGSVLTYTLNLRNKDAHTAYYDVELEDEIPDGLEIDESGMLYYFGDDAATSAPVTGASDVTFTRSGQKLTFTVKRLGANRNVKFVIPTTVKKLETAFDNQASITAIQGHEVVIESDITNHRSKGAPMLPVLGGPGIGMLIIVGLALILASAVMFARVWHRTGEHSIH